MKKCVILLGGDIIVTPRLAEMCKGAFVLAADSGVRHAASLGLKVDCWLGDFDSTPAELAREFDHLPRKVFPRDKDKTDGELAIDEGIARGCTIFLLVGAFGGPRTDHALLHGLQGVALRERGFDVVLANGLEEGWPVIPGSITIPMEVGTIFSVIGFVDMHGVSIAGAKWPLLNQFVPLGSSLTMSNVATGDVVLTVGDGNGLFIAGSSGAR